MRALPTLEQQFTSLFEMHADHVRRYAMSLVTGDDAHDVFQRTFTTAWQHFGDLPPGFESQRKWLFGVVRNHCNNQRRTTRRADALIAAITHSRPRSVTEPNVNELDPVEAAPLLQVLSELSDDECELMVLTGWLEMTPAEVSEMLGQNVNTTRSHLFRLRKRMAVRYSELTEDGASA